MAHLSEQAIRILSERYLRYTGECQETPGDMFWRVARAIGRDGEEAREFFDAMNALDFLPNSPTLMNAGTPGGQLSACFPAGTMIETRSVPTPIESIVVGDYVLTERGIYEEVVHTMQRDGRLWRVKIDRLPEMFVTGEHPFMTERGWVAVKDLIPKTDFVRVGRLPIVVADQSVGCMHLAEHKANHDRRAHRVPDKVDIDCDMAWLIGVYLANGCCAETGDFRVTFNLKDADHAKRVVEIVRDRLHIPARIERSKQPEGFPATPGRGLSN